MKHGQLVDIVILIFFRKILLGLEEWVKLNYQPIAINKKPIMMSL